MAKNTSLDGGTVRKSKMYENNQCQWTVKEEIVLFWAEAWHDLSSVLEESLWLLCGELTAWKSRFWKQGEL